MKAVEPDLEVLAEVAWNMCYNYGSDRALHALERNMLLDWLCIVWCCTYICLITF